MFSRIWNYFFPKPQPVKVEAPKEIPAPVNDEVSPVKSLFPNQDWANYVWKLVADMPTPGDQYILSKKGMTRTNWVHFFAAMAKHESNFKPELEYRENFKNGRGETVISTGLFQLSYESARSYGFTGITTEDLKDPYKNIEVAVAIMKKWVKADGVINGKHFGKYLGGARYWSVIRAGKAQATFKTICE